MRYNVVFILLLILSSQGIHAHGDLHERIKKVTKEIAESPDSAYLYLKRGKLYFQHEAFLKSKKDLHKSKELGFVSDEQQILFARVYYRLNDFDKSLSYSESILSRSPEHVRALRVNAQAQQALGNFGLAALSYEKVISHSAQRFPENYIEASIAWELSEDEQSHKNAIRIIERGIKDIGPIITFYSRIIELAISKKDYTLAIEKQIESIDLLSRKEMAYYKLSELYMLNGEDDNALLSLIEAKKHMERLPERVKNTAAMQQLQQNIKSEITNLMTK